MGARTFHIDWIAIIAAFLLLTLGLITLLSIQPSLFTHQLVVAIIGILFFIVVMRIDIRLIHYFDIHLVVVSLLFLAISFLGPQVRGTTSWLEVGGFRIQPSEIVKPMFILGISSLLIRFPLTKMKHILMHVGIFLLFFLLIFLQPDLGNGIVYASIFAALLLVSGLPLWLLFLGSIGASITGPIFFTILKEYQKRRILSFLNPLLDPRGSGYNAIQSLIAVGSGGLFGRGYGRGTQSMLEFLPERHTDFIFASFAESFGFIGGFVMIFLVFVLLYRVLTHTKLVHSQLAELYCVGFFMQLFTQSLIHIGMNMGVLPITGITLPFVSYGGSSLLAGLVGLGLYVAAIQGRKT